MAFGAQRWPPFGWPRTMLLGLLPPVLWYTVRLESSNQMLYTISPNQALYRLASQSTPAIPSCPTWPNALPTLLDATIDWVLGLPWLL
jgi:hypothetical protein